MKKTSFLIVLFLIIITNTFAQIEKGLIVYKIDKQGSMDKVGKEIDKKLSYMIQLEVDMAKDIELELIFNNKLSIFKAKKSLVINRSSHMQDMFDFQKSLASGGVFYTNLDRKKQINRKTYGKETYNLLSDIQSINWQLSTETKKIGDFLCYKAKYIKKMFNGKQKMITAWYTPEIPLQYGPLDYAGTLPGLIMELDDTYTKYTCSEIKLNPKKNINIEWPSETNTMTRAEYLKMGEENSTWRQN